MAIATAFFHCRPSLLICGQDLPRTNENWPLEQHSAVGVGEPAALGAVGDNLADSQLPAERLALRFEINSSGKAFELPVAGIAATKLCDEGRKVGVGIERRFRFFRHRLVGLRWNRELVGIAKKLAGDRRRADRGNDWNKRLASRADLRRRNRASANGSANQQR